MMARCRQGRIRSAAGVGTARQPPSPPCRSGPARFATSVTGVSLFSGVTPLKLQFRLRAMTSSVRCISHAHELLRSCIWHPRSRGNNPGDSAADGRGVTVKLPRIVLLGLMAGLSASLLAGCVHPQPPKDATSPASPEVSGGSPPTETTTRPERPQSPSHAVGISFAPLPTGKRDNQGACLHVAWLTQPIPHGDVVTVTSVIVRSPFTFDPGAAARCSGGPSCAGYQFSAANDDGQIFCNVGFGYIGGVIDEENGTDQEVSVQLAGQLRCPDTGSAECRHDAAVMQSSGIASITLGVGVDLSSSPGSGSSSPPASSSSPPGSPSASPSPLASSSLTAQGSS
jgi:hypothetical protein